MNAFEKLVEAHIDRFDVNGLGRNYNITEVFIDKFSHLNWDWNDVVHYRPLSSWFVEKYKSNIDFPKYSSSHHLRSDITLKFPNQKWDFQELSQKEVHPDFILQHIDKNWDWEALNCNTQVNHKSRQSKYIEILKPYFVETISAIIAEFICY